MGEKQPQIKRAQRAKMAAAAEEKRVLKAFGKNLQRCMDEAGYDTDWQLMLDSGVNNATIGRYKSGDQEPGILKVMRLAKALGVPVTELLRDPQAPASPSLGRRKTDREGPLLPGSPESRGRAAGASETDGALGASS